MEECCMQKMSVIYINHSNVCVRVALQRDTMADLMVRIHSHRLLRKKK